LPAADGKKKSKLKLFLYRGVTELSGWSRKATSFGLEAHQYKNLQLIILNF
jgi:hypothetical protein